MDGSLGSKARVSRVASERLAQHFFFLIFYLLHDHKNDAIERGI
jgi:hypothetical protein